MLQTLTTVNQVDGTQILQDLQCAQRDMVGIVSKRSALQHYAGKISYSFTRMMPRTTELVAQIYARGKRLNKSDLIFLRNP